MTWRHLRTSAPASVTTQIAEQLADLGASLGGGADTDRASIRCARCRPATNAIRRSTS